MKTLIFLCCIAVVYGQYACGDCDSEAIRQDVVGCKLFCDVDGGGGIWTGEDMNATYTRWGCGAGCDVDAFAAAVMPITGICRTESDRAFAILATQDPALDPNLVENGDVHGWRTAIITDYSLSGECDEAAFRGWWDFRYPLLEDPGCTPI